MEIKFYDFEDYRWRRGYVMTFEPPPSLFELERDAFWTSLIRTADRKRQTVELTIYRSYSVIRRTRL